MRSIWHTFALSGIDGRRCIKKQDGNFRLNSNLENIDPEELCRFAAQADAWWAPRGELKALHEINPLRLAYVRNRVGLAGRHVLDVGCGGGLLAEAMAAEKALVTGIDMVASALTVARKHAAETGIRVTYDQSTAEAWAQDHQADYDVITCMELVEHVPDPALLTRTLAILVRPGGHIFVSTVNRTWLARLLVIWASENLLGIVHKGTHTYHKFVQPEELIFWGRQSGLNLSNLSGVRYLPFIGHAALCKSTAMNYMVHFTRPDHA